MPNDILLPRILLTNDDGFAAAGLKVLAEIAASFAQEVWIVAPDEDQSGASQRVSLRAPLSARRHGERSWSVKGTPSDCVALALDHFMLEARPSLVLSGVNASSNIGDELNLSGTVGAAMTALMLGVPAIAISQDGPSRRDIPWETTRAILPFVLRHLLSEGWRKETALNVNIPALPPEKIGGLRWARQTHKNIGNVKTYRRISPRGEDYFWLGLIDKQPVPQPDSEAAILARGEIAVTALTADRSVDANKAFVPFVKPCACEMPDPDRLHDE